MQSPTENRMYKMVLRDVLWGESKDQVFKTLEVNGIFGFEAEELYSTAQKERIALLRHEALVRLVKGALIAAAGIGVFCLFWFGFGAITRWIYVICGVGTIWGTWWFFDGLINWMLAAQKKGSVATDH